MFRTFVVLSAFLLTHTSTMADQNCPALLDHEIRHLNSEQSVRLCEEYQNQVLLIVNTASECGFTYQYEGLEALQAELKQQGFSVLGFPSNDFGAQEPGSEAQVQNFCRSQYGIQFPMFEKVNVKGPQAIPLYQQLSEASSAPRWNFYKYLVGRDGELIAHFSSFTKPDSKKLRQAIERAL